MEDLETTSGLEQAAALFFPSQSTSGAVGVLEGSKQQDRAPQVIPMADDRGFQVRKDWTSPNPPGLPETQGDPGWLQGQARWSLKKHDPVDGNAAHGRRLELDDL
ncbi:hypothetical protein WISP_44068 [Willisornis vidua]|uniref:ALMS1 protein n=1 Tax=Willisornis vidua TaxID=1566151 RepID=A0ABQ9DKF5_9PASS|nr:hypothetical protein WISP_44068 [Willisornis vidua]